MQRIALTLAGIFSLALAGCPSDNGGGTTGGTGGGGGTGGRGGSSGTGGGGGTGGSGGTGGARPPDAGRRDTGRAPDSGRTPDGGRRDGGGVDMGGAASVSPMMNFFITSRGGRNGGDLRLNMTDADGLAGADALCKELATAASAAVGAKDWKAYLSTSTVDARSRIGAGPWFNARGVMVAQNLAQLHEEGGMLNAVRVTGMPSNALDEGGQTVPMGGGQSGVHDILTGSNAMGLKDPMGRHCNNWTSTMGQAFVGHHDRMGGPVNGNQLGAWNAVHAVGCGAIMGNQNGVIGTVSSGGGRGSFYCFAAN